MLKQKKGALELSVNTIVIIVIAVTLLTLGLVFVKTIFGNLTDITKQTFEQADQEIRSQLATGDDPFYILGRETTMERGTLQTMYVGIKNNEPSLINVRLSSSQIGGGNSGISISLPNVQTPIQPGSIETISFTVSVPKNEIIGPYQFRIEDTSRLTQGYFDDIIVIVK
jgi:hypothetical protein